MATDLDRVMEYYRQTGWQYKLVWSPEHLHYGWWDDGVSSHAASLTRMLEVLANAGSVYFPGTKVLDAGCGTGGTARWLAEARGAQVVGVSVVPEQIAEANRIRLRKGVRGVRFFCADYRDLPLPNESFEVVFAIESSCYARPKLDFLTEAFRVLEPGGRLVVADFYRTGQATQRLERCLEEWEQDWAMPRLQTPDEWYDDLLTAGFSRVSSWDVTRNVLPSARRLRRLVRVFGPLARLSALWAPRVPIRNILSAQRQWEVLSQGAACYRITVASKQ